MAGGGQTPIETPNWILELRGFFQRQINYPLSPHAQAMWQYLMYRANSAWWKFPLVLHLSELSGALNMSITTVKKAREELVSGRYILHESQRGNRAACYYILSMVSDTAVPIGNCLRVYKRKSYTGEDSNQGE